MNNKNKFEELKQEFFTRFVSYNRNTNLSLWWRVPKTLNDPEIASPAEVWAWIEKVLKVHDKEIIKRVREAEKAGDQFGTLYELLKS